MTAAHAGHASGTHNCVPLPCALAPPSEIQEGGRGPKPIPPWFHYKILCVPPIS